MNTRQEIETAMQDFRSGKFGQLPVPNHSAEVAPSAS
jgi:hypothetical protein